MLAEDTKKTSIGHSKSDMLDPLLALSPLDGRYASRTEPLRESLSEFALIRARVHVELRWLAFLVSEGIISLSQPVPESELRIIETISDDFELKDARRVKELEKITNHDVKAVEYFIREKLGIKIPRAALLIPLVHFACTSEDVNNVAYSMNLEKMRSKVILPKISELLVTTARLIDEAADIPLLAYTHGQPASPTTLGKEISVFYARIHKLAESFKQVKLAVKWNGAT